MPSRPIRHFLLPCLLTTLAALAWATDGWAGNEGERPSVVRMAVDPTVLPPIVLEDDEPPLLVEDMNATQPTEADAVVFEPSSSTPAAKTKPQPEAAAAEPATGGEAFDLRLTGTPDGFVVTVRGSVPIGDTSYFALADPPRLVIDLRGAWRYNGDNVLRPDDSRVKHAVVGEHPDRLRLVIHLAQQPAGRLAPVFSRSGRELAVSVKLP